MIALCRPAGMLNEVELCAWIGQASPGDVLEYHRGFLALDKAPFANRLTEAERADLILMSRRALWAAEEGLVHLVQQRLGPDHYRYLAIARPKTEATEQILSSLIDEEAA